MCKPVWGKRYDDSVKRSETWPSKRAAITSLLWFDSPRITFSIPIFGYNKHRFGYNCSLVCAEFCINKKTENENYNYRLILGHISKPLTEELAQKGHSVTVISSNSEKQKDIEALSAKAAIGPIENRNCVYLFVYCESKEVDTL